MPPVAAPEPTGSAIVFDDGTIALMIKTVLLQQDINVEDVRIVDGRPNGGEKVCLMTWRLATEAPSLEEILGPLGHMFGAALGANKSAGAELDSVTVIAGNPQGITTMTITAAMNDVSAFLEGNLSPGDFYSRWTIVDF